MATKKVWSWILDFAPPAIALGAATVAVVGLPKWDQSANGIEKVTVLGWGVIAVAVLAFVVSVFVAQRNRSERAQARAARERVAEIGRERMLEALRHTVHPLLNSGVWGRTINAPESPMEFLSADHRSQLVKLDLNACSPYGEGSFREIKWCEMIDTAACSSADELTRTLQIFASYLSPEAINAVIKVSYSDFLRHRLMHTKEIVMANTHDDASRVVPFIWAIRDGARNADYDDFWVLLADAMILCGATRDSQGGPLFRAPSLSL